MKAAIDIDTRGLRSWISVVKLGDFTLLCLLVFSLFSYGTVWTGLSGGQLIAARLAMASVCLVALLPSLLRKRFSSFEVVVVLYSLMLMVQGFFTQNPGNAVLQGVLTFAVMLLPRCFADRYGSQRLMDFMFWIFLMIAVSMDVLAVLTGGEGVLTQETEYVWSSNYVFGNKFALSYINMLFLGLVIYRFKSLVVIVPAALFCIYCCSIAACSTGIVGILLLLLSCIFFEPLKTVIANKWFIAGCVIAMALVSVAAAGLMQLPAIQAFTVGVLGESSDFSGRLEIYPHLMRLWFESPVIGFGSSNAANTVMMQAIGAPNTQEGLFQILFSNGFIGGILFLAICVLSTKGISRLERRGRGVYAFVIAMAFCSLVEINLSALFLLGLSLVNAMTFAEPAMATNESDTSKKGTSRWASRISLGS